MRRVSSALILVAAATLAAGCSTDFNETGGLRKAVGLTSSGPDEFLVVSKAPLVVPPDMNLRPPRPGADPLGAVDTRSEARSSITGAQGGAAVATGGSAGEQAILSRANAHQADPAVREELLREQGIESKDKTVADQILEQQQTVAETLDPWSEADRLRGEVASGEQATAEQQQQQTGGQPSSILLEDILGGN